MSPLDIRQKRTDVADNVISYIQMCLREGTSLQAGMNFGLGGNHSVILMSVRPNAPYRDRLEDAGTTLIYEGHDMPKRPDVPNPKVVDQPEGYSSGAPTQNGRFHRAAQGARAGKHLPERVRVYEKIRTGIWSYNGIFHLVDSWQEQDDAGKYLNSNLSRSKGRKICQFLRRLTRCGAVLFRPQ